MKRQATRPKHIKKAVFVLVWLLLAVGTITFFVRHESAIDLGVESEEQTVTSTEPDPDESKENAVNYQWRGANQEPKKLKIPSIAVDTYIQKMGIDTQSRIAVPTNIHLSGWYQGSVLPGQDGIAVIVGHVTGKYEDGIFKNISSLKKGDEITLEMGSGASIRYQVLNVIKVPEKNATNYLFSAEKGVAKQLNLITCGGEFDKVLNQYEDRIIVSSKEI